MSARCRLGALRREHIGGHTAVTGAAETGAGETGTAVTGTAVTGVAETGTAETGAAETGAAVIGMAAIGMIIMVTMMSSSSATSAFHGGGVGVRIIRGDILTDITATVMVAATDTVATDTVATDTVATAMVATDTVATAMVATAIMTANASLDMGTDPAPDQGWLSCNADSPAPAITMAPLMESWGRKRAEQFELTSATTDTQTQANPVFRAAMRLADHVSIFRLVDRRISQGRMGEPPVSLFSATRECTYGWWDVALPRKL
jgi:hypothetical protein